MLERFQSVLDRLDALERRVGQLSSGLGELRLQFVNLHSDFGKLVVRLDGVDASIYELTMRVNGLGDDMRQRFRLVTDRLYAVEQRLAA